MTFKIHIPKKAASIAQVCAKDTKRFALDAVKIEGLGDGGLSLTATDGTILVLATYEGGSFDETSERFTCLVGGKSFSQAFKAFSGMSDVTLEADLMGHELRLSRDGVTVNVPGARFDVAASYPSMDGVIPKRDGMALSTVSAFDPARLARVVKVGHDVIGAPKMDGKGGGAFRLQLGDDRSPARLDFGRKGRTAIGVIMPVKVEGVRREADAARKSYEDICKAAREVGAAV